MSETKRILVVGGAGYIGSHMVKVLLERGHAVTTLDNLSLGHADAVVGGEFVRGDLADPACLKDLFARGRFDGVMHFAAFAQVGESVAHPAKYYRNNVANTLNLLDAMVGAGVRDFIFSSSCAVFGNPVQPLMNEDHPKAPVNPYGRSKLMVEQILEDYERAHGLKSACLRYFNAAGADPGGRLGERHDPETHLIPVVLQAASGRRPGVTVMGSDYDTPDGSAVRDYIHILDLCDAHLAALEWLAAGRDSLRLNLGTGTGFSVREVIAAAQHVTGRSFPVTDGARRPGDPPRLVADATLARKVLGWQPRYAALDVIIEHAWKWEISLAKR